MHTVTVVWQMEAHRVLPWALLYIGPDVFLPLASALAAIAGVAMMFWQRLVGWMRTLWRMIVRAGIDRPAE